MRRTLLAARREQSLSLGIKGEGVLIAACREQNPADVSGPAALLPTNGFTVPPDPRSTTPGLGVFSGFGWKLPAVASW